MASFSKLDLTFLALAYEAYPRRARMSDVLAHPVVKDATNEELEMCIINLQEDGFVSHDMIDTSTLSGGKSIAIRGHYHISLTTDGVGLVQSLMPKQEDRRIEGFGAQP